MNSPELFPDFQSSEAAFAECVEFWRAMMDEVAKGLGQDGRWRTGYVDPEVGEYPAPVEPLEVRTTFEGYSPALRRMFQVYQFPRAQTVGDSDVVEISVKTVPFGPSGAQPVLLMLARLIATSSSVEVVRRALNLLMDPKTSEHSLMRDLPRLTA